MKFTVTGVMKIEVTATVEAEDAQDAESQLDSADCCVESGDDTITFNSCCQTGFDSETVVCDAEQKWEGLDKSERMEILKGNDVSAEAAYDIAGRDFDDIPEEWQQFFD